MTAYFRVGSRAVIPGTVEDPERIEAMVSSYDVLRFSRDGKQRKRPVMGEINFYRGGLGVATIAHEIAHAAIVWAQRIKIDPMADPDGHVTHPDNERFAAATGAMYGQLAYHCERLKAW